MQGPYKALLFADQLKNLAVFEFVKFQKHFELHSSHTIILQT